MVALAPTEISTQPRGMERSSPVVQPEWFAGDALQTARQMIGLNLCRQVGEVVHRWPITETEAYVGPHDKACHAHKGRTARTEVMFGAPGHWYVYLCYGVHWLLNIVTGPEDYPAAVLLRGAGEVTGPGRLTKALSIGKPENTCPAIPATGLWFEQSGSNVPDSEVSTTPRIGIAYAAEWVEKPYRFVWKRES